MMKLRIIAAAFALAVSAPLSAGATDILPSEVTVESLIEEKIFDTFLGPIPEDLELRIEVDSQGRLAESLRDFSQDLSSGRFTATAVRESGDSFRIGGRVQMLVPLHVPARRLPQGHIIAAEDLRAVHAPYGLVSAQTLRSAEELLGMEVRRPVMADRPIPATSVSEPILVRRGENVEIQYQHLGMRLVTMARAMEDGTRGETIRTINLTSRRPVFAEVIADGVVRISR